MMKKCNDCLETKPISDFYKAHTGKYGVAGHCKECHKERMHKRHWAKREDILEKKRKYYAGNKEAHRESTLINLYGITLEDYDNMLKDQDYCCAICGTDEPKGRGRFHVDHDHDTGDVRGLLCHHCNVMLGQAKDDVMTLLNAVEYLQLSRLK